MRDVKTILVKVLVNAVAIWVASLAVPEVGVTAGSVGQKVVSLLVVGALFGLVNTFIKPLVDLFTLPLKILTLGLFSFVVNALMLKLVDVLSGAMGIGFSAGHFFWSTLAAAVVVTFVSMILHVALKPTPISS
jgi:putative membrane protein